MHMAEWMGPTDVVMWCRRKCLVTGVVECCCARAVFWEARRRVGDYGDCGDCGAYWDQHRDGQAVVIR